MSIQQILLALNNESVVLPPPPVLVPSGDPFIIDLDFPGPYTGIPLTAVYTFPQAVSFPNDTTFNASMPFFGSTITYTGAPTTQVNFYLKPPDGTSLDTVDIVFQSSPHPIPADGVYRALFNNDLIWANSHGSGGEGSPFYGSGKFTWYAGEQLFLQIYYDAGGATLADIHLHLVGTAV